MSRENSILTFTNTLFYPLDPRLDEVKVEDIAHALSQMCRANGHFRTFYSVAQHSINCAREARASGLPSRIQLACLLHDASEAYISDITRPVKCYLDEYRKIEHRLQNIIFEKFGLVDLTEEELRHVVDIDNAVLCYEFDHLHHQCLPKYPYKLTSQPDVSEKRMTSVEAEFIQLLRQIMNAADNYRAVKCVGIDSCKKVRKYQGWAAFWQLSNGDYGFNTYPNITGLMAEHYDADCLLIDIPIGLPETLEDELGRPDQQLRERLYGKKSSVFNTPCREAIYCDDKQEAKAINLQVLKKSLSEQSLGFSKKIREVDRFLYDRPQFIGRLRESHPEYGFAVLNHGRPLISKKSERSGIEERQTLLNHYFHNATKAIGEILAKYPKQLADDFIDAMVLSVIGQIGMLNGFVTIPDYPKKDSRGLPSQIHQKLDSEGMQWLRIEPKSEISGFVGLEPNRELFDVLHKNFPMVAEFIDQPNHDVCINKTKPMPWKTRGDLMEWMASIVEANIWGDVKVHPFLVFANAANWKPNFTAGWKSPAIESWTSLSSGLLVPNPNARISALTAKFTIEEYGWATLHLQIDDTKHEIQLSNVFPPFWDILSWIKMVERGQLPVSVTIDEEGTEKVLSVEPLYNSEQLLFRLAEKYEVRYLAEALISRPVLVQAFYEAFCDLLNTGFNPDEWSDTDYDSDNKKYLNMADDEWFHRN